MNRICKQCKIEFMDDTGPDGDHEKEFKGIDWNICGNCRDKLVKVTVRVDFTFAPDEYSGRRNKSLCEWACIVMEDMLHGEADLTDDHEISECVPVSSGPTQ